MSETDRSFHIVPSPASEDAFYRESIAKMCSLPVDAVSKEELELLYDARKVSRISPHLLKYVGTDALARGSRAFMESSFRFFLESEAYINKPTLSRTFGGYSPSYLKMLNNYAESRKNSGESHKALLLGAHTVSTVREYTGLVRQVFSGATCLVIDIENATLAQETADISLFAKADAKKLPFQTIDTLYTNHLLGFISGLKVPSQKRDRMLLFKSCFEALADGGALMMVEDLGNDLSVEKLTQELHRIGFEDIVVERAEEFKYRRDMDRYFRGTSPVIPEGESYLGNSVAIKASKAAPKPEIAL